MQISKHENSQQDNYHNISFGSINFVSSPFISAHTIKPDMKTIYILVISLLFFLLSHVLGFSFIPKSDIFKSLPFSLFPPMHTLCLQGELVSTINMNPLHSFLLNVCYF